VTNFTLWRDIWKNNWRIYIICNKYSFLWYKTWRKYSFEWMWIDVPVRIFFDFKVNITISFYSNSKEFSNKNYKIKHCVTSKSSNGKIKIYQRTKLRNVALGTYILKRLCYVKRDYICPKGEQVSQAYTF